MPVYLLIPSGAHRPALVVHTVRVASLVGQKEFGEDKAHPDEVLDLHRVKDNPVRSLAGHLLGLQKVVVSLW